MQLQIEKFFIMQQNATFIHHLKGLMAKWQPQGWTECLLGTQWCEGCSKVSLCLNFFRCQFVFSKHLSPWLQSNSEADRKYITCFFIFPSLDYSIFFFTASISSPSYDTVSSLPLACETCTCSTPHVLSQASRLTLCLPFFTERDFTPFSGSFSASSEWGLNISCQQG